MFTKRYKSHHDVKDFISKNIKKKLVLPFSYWNKFNKPALDSDGGIYVHVPFCDKICSFCNMNRKKLDNDLEDYTNYLIKEINKYRNKKYILTKKFSVIFFGGGTPTILKPHQLEKVLSTLREVFPMKEDFEFTFETTLHNLSWNKLEVMKKYGVNRLSIGIQTFSNRGRKLLNRTSDEEFVFNRLQELRSRFNGLICLDIIYNYFDETEEEVLNDVKRASQFKADSVSFYSLMIHNGSEISKSFSEETLRTTFAIENDKKLHDIFLANMKNSGYEVLEHTKLSLGKDKYLYIRNTHKLKDLIPIGVGAGGRVQNIELFHLNKFVTFYAKDSSLAIEAKKLSGVCQYEIVYFSDILEFTKVSKEKLFDTLKVLKDKNYITIYDEYFKFTNDGIFWGNNIAAFLIENLLLNK